MARTVLPIALPCAVAVAVAVASRAAPAQDLVPKAPPQPAPVVLTNATIHTVTGGVVLGGTIWFDGGTIQGVLPPGEEPQLPPGRAPIVLDLQQKHVFPGLISAHSSLGLVEIGAVRQTVDTDELGELSPEALALTAVNPDSAAIPVARSNGVLAAAVFPSGGLLPGRTSVIQLDGWTNADLAVRGDGGPVVAWPADRSAGPRFGRGRRTRDRGAEDEPDGDGKDRTERLRQRIDDAFAAAQAWLAARTADPDVAFDVRHAALAPALRGEVPVFVLADDSEQIESAVLWAVQRTLRIVIVGGRDARACADLLKRHDVPVIVDGVHRLPERDDSAYDEAFTLPRDLAELGVRFCIATGQDFSNERNLPYHAATAVAFGLDPARALRAITADAAEILGVGDHLGALAKGKDATLFVADGHPFDLPTKIEMAFVSGRRIDLRNKQTELAQKYRERYRQLRAR